MLGFSAIWTRKLSVLNRPIRPAGWLDAADINSARPLDVSASGLDSVSLIDICVPFSSNVEGTRLCHRYRRLNSMAIQFGRYQRSLGKLAGFRRNWKWFGPM